MRRRLLPLLGAVLATALCATPASSETPGLRNFGTYDGFAPAGSGRAQMSLDGLNHMRIDYLNTRDVRTDAVWDIWFPALCPPGNIQYIPGGALRIPFKSPLPFIDCQPTYDGRFFVNRVPQGELGYRPNGWNGDQPGVWSQFITYVDKDGIYFELAIGN